MAPSRVVVRLHCVPATVPARSWVLAWVIALLVLATSLGQAAFAGATGVLGAALGSVTRGGGGAEASGVAAGLGEPGRLPQGSVMPSTRSIPVLCLDAQGRMTERMTSRQALAQELGCPLRDLRLIDPTFPGQFPAVLVRPGAIVFAVDHVKAVVKAGEMLLFSDAEDPEVMGLVPTFQQQLAHRVEGGAPFEHVAVECCLGAVCQSLLGQVKDVEPRLRQVLAELRPGLSTGRGHKPLEKLLPLKNELDELQTSLEEVFKCMNDVLLSEEDMSKMYLTDARGRRRARDVARHEEVEMMFENYLLQVELLCSDVRELRNEMKNTEEIVEIQLDVLRNRILRFELMLSISSFTVALGALVTGVFGMNLVSNLEEHRSMFWLVTGGIYGGMVAAVFATVVYCRRHNLL